MIELNLPLPTPTNNLYLNLKGKGRVRTPKYRAWQNEAGWEIARQNVGKFHGPCEIEIAVSDKARGDIDGRVKATLDVLVKFGVIEDDRKKFVKSVKAYWSDVAGVRVKISPFSDE